MNLLKKIWDRVMRDIVYDDQGRIMAYSVHCIFHPGDVPDPECKTCIEHTERFYNEQRD